MRRQHSQLCQTSWTQSRGGLISVTLVVLGTVNLRFQGQSVPFFEASSWNCGSVYAGSSLLIRQLTLSTCWGFQYLQDSSQSIIQNIIYSPSEGTKGSWLCLMTKLYYLLSLFSSVSACSHFSDSAYSLAKLFHRQKTGRGHGRGHGEGPWSPAPFQEEPHVLSVCANPIKL